MNIFNTEGNHGLHLENEYPYFTIQDYHGVNEFYYICDSAKLKTHYRNKSIILYSIDINWKYIIEEIDLINFKSSMNLWAGIFYEKYNKFYKNPTYTGKINLQDIINILRGERI